MISNSLTYDFIKKFAGIKSLTKKVDPERVSNLKKEINDKCVQYEATLSNLKSQMRLLNSEVGNMLKMTDQHDNVESVESDIKIQSLESNTSVFKTTYGIIEILTLAIKSYKDLIERLDLDGKFIPGEGHLQFDYSFEDIQKMHMMSGMSSDIMNKYVEALLSIEGSKGYIAKVAWEIINELNSLNQLLVKRHGTDGVEIYGDVVSTDIAITLFKNVDNNGEIESVEDINMMSAFSRRKAEIISMLVYTDPMKAIIRSPNNIISVVESTMKVLWDWSDEFSRIFSDEVFKAKQYYSSSNLVGPKSFQDLMDEISDFDPNLVKFKSSSKFMTSEEKFYVEFINTTIKGIVELMKDEGSDQEQLVNFILSRKVVLNKRNKNKCTFYKCKIGEGNRFKQIPPGMLTIVPDDKPNASIDEIWGQGFDEVKDHLDSINMSVEWHDIFLATSPSKSADKSNMLLVGPQGCGKCVTGDTLISSDQGLIKIEDLNPGTDFDGYGELEIGVRSINGKTKSSHFYDDGVRPVIKIQSRHGFIIKGTAKHRVICSGPNGVEWKKLDEISVNDYVAIVRNNLPQNDEYFDPELAYVLGYYVGDGSPAGKKDNPIHLCFTISSLDIDDFESRCFPTIKNNLGNPHKYKDKRSACYNVQVFNTKGKAKEVYESCGRGSFNKKVPEQILKSNKTSWKFFLQGLFDADGSTYGRRAELSSNSYNLLNTVQQMLLHFGIISTVQNKKSNKNSWRLFIYGSNLRIFSEEIGFGHKRKMDKLLEECKSETVNSNYDIVPIQKSLWERLKKECSPLRRDVHKRMDHYHREGCFPNHHTLEKLFDFIPQCESKDLLSELANKDYFWDKVIEVKDIGFHQVYDLSVPNGESFVANGFMNHNTQVLRAIGSDEDSISIFAQGSDFLTCWMGEAEKNPKRLFEGAAKLQRDTGKHVYILIDEADSVMKDSSLMKHGDVNLTLEFQICMDGVLNYPNITIVAATNHLGHMPSPIIRRFSKVLIVGELTKEDRIKVIKHYLDYMPIKGFKSDHWTDFAERLEGSTGDIIRKIVDHIWRTKITSFVKNNKKEAREVLDVLRKDGDKFELSKFDEEKREEFKSSLSKFFHIEPSDVNKSITMHLDNIGIQTEIETAVAVYEEAHKLVKSFNKNKVLM